MLRHTTRCVAARERSEDVVFVHERGNALFVTLVDGAGGMSGGRRAAELAAALLLDAEPPETPQGMRGLLLRLDDRLEADPHAGETTVVVARVEADRVVGASAGDSSLVLFHDSRVDELTEHQHKKRRVGSGRADPVGFSAAPRGGFRLLAGSDGLFGYASFEALQRAARAPTLSEAASSLLALPRGSTGRYVDDVSFALVERP